MSGSSNYTRVEEYFYNGKTDKYPISYRLVILHAVFSYLKNIVNQAVLLDDEQLYQELSKIKSKLSKVRNKLDQDNMQLNVPQLTAQYLFPDLFDIYIINVYDDDRAAKRTFAIYVDQSICDDGGDAIYPLMFYPERKGSESADRFYVFKRTLDEMMGILSGVPSDVLMCNIINHARNDSKWTDIKNELCDQLDNISSN